MRAGPGRFSDFKLIRRTSRKSLRISVVSNPISLSVCANNAIWVNVHALCGEESEARKTSHPRAFSRLIFFREKAFCSQIYIRSRHSSIYLLCRVLFWSKPFFCNFYVFLDDEWSEKVDGEWRKREMCSLFRGRFFRLPSTSPGLSSFSWAKRPYMLRLFIQFHSFRKLAKCSLIRRKTHTAHRRIQNISITASERLRFSVQCKSFSAI